MPYHNATENKYISGDFDNILGITHRMDKGLGSQISAATAFGKGLEHGCPEAASKKSHSLNLPDA